METKSLPIDDIRPYERNPRKNDQAVDAVIESIKQCGYIAPIIIDENNVIIAGHTRYKALKRLNYTQVDLVVKAGLTEEQKRKYRLLDNKTNELAAWDFGLLAEELDGLDFGDLDLDWGIGEDEEEKEVVEDEVPEVDEENEPIVRIGDIWHLGRHRLMCGDSTDKRMVERLMNGELADMVFTDPPYGMKKEKDGVTNDNLNFDDLLEFNKKWIPLSFEHTKDNGSWYCWGIDEPLMDIYAEILKPMIKAKQIAFRNLITWDKGSGQGQLSEEFRMYPIADEKCLFVMCGGESVQGFCVNAEDYNPAMDKVRLYMVGEAERLGITPAKIKEICGCGMYRRWFTKSQFSIPTCENYEKLQKYYVKGDGFKKEYDELKKEYDELKKEYDEIKKEFYEGRSYFDNAHDNMNNVWHFSRPDNSERAQTGGHATPKPIALCSRAIKSSSREGETVLDLFGGSGSTLIACEQLNRKCRVMELEPKWCDVIIRRWEILTGQKAVRIHCAEQG